MQRESSAAPIEHRTRRTKSRERHFAPLLSFVVIASTLVLFSSSDAGASNYGQAQVINAADLTGISCPSVSNCTAVGNSTTVARQVNGNWSTSVKLTPAFLGEDPLLNSISCVDTQDCTAVGYDPSGFATYATEVSGTWGAVTTLNAPSSLGQIELVSVSCPVIGNCTAIGSDSQEQAVIVDESNGTWGSVALAPANLTYENLYGIDCTAVGTCSVVGDGGAAYLSGSPIVVTEVGGTWGTPQSFAGQGGFKSVSCVDASDCTAVGIGGPVGQGVPIYATESSGVWDAPTEISPTNIGLFSWFTSVSCANATNCMAVGVETTTNVPFTVVEDNGVWGPAILVSLPGNTADNPISGTLTGVSCIGANLCTAVGGDSNGIQYWGYSA